MRLPPKELSVGGRRRLNTSRYRLANVAGADRFSRCRERTRFPPSSVFGWRLLPTYRLMDSGGSLFAILSPSFDEFDANFRRGDHFVQAGPLQRRVDIVLAR